MTTIHDVAKKAGVAPITVSRVINNSGYVSDTLRAKVNAAIEELGYVPNVLARSLKSKRTNTLALVFTDITNPFFNVMARGVEDAASDEGFNVIFCNTDESQEQEIKYIHLLLQKQVDGILLIPADSDSKSIDIIRTQKTPLVIVDRRVGHKDVDIVRGDSEGGAYQITEHLINLGHRRISLLTGPQQVSTAEDRVQGYKRAMEAHGLHQYIDYHYGFFNQQSGATQARQLFSRDDKPTAIFAGNNLISIGALAALRELHIKVPQDVAMVCFDGIPENLSSIPFMTAVTQPSYEMGKRATELLISRIQSPTNTPVDYQDIVFPCQLILRESSGEKLTAPNIIQN
ncbi:MAG: LacI family DNA-binding transcriptional regulator [Anaerolineales bacterium]